MHDSSRRAVLQIDVGLLAVLGGCSSKLDSNETMTGASGNSMSETAVPETNPISHEAIRWYGVTNGGVKPVVNDGAVYAGSRSLAAIDAEDGHKHWEFTPDNPIRSEIMAGANGVTFTVGKVGTATYYDTTLYCLAPESDVEIQFEFSPEEETVGFPRTLAMDSDSVYVGFSDDQRGNSGHQTCAFSYDGKRQWMNETSDSLRGTLQDDTLFIPTAGRFEAIDTNSGQERWAYDSHRLSDRYIAGERVLLVDVVDETDTEYSLVSLDSKSGGEEWSFSPGTRIMARVEGGTVYALHGEPYNQRDITAFSVVDGNENWSKSFDSPVDKLVVSSSIVAVQTDREIVALASDGSRQWSYSPGRWVKSMTATEETLYVTEVGTLRAFDAKTGNERFQYVHGEYSHGVSPRLEYTGETTLVRSEERDTLTALERDGTVRWEFENPSGLSDVTVADTTAYTTAEDGYLYALDF